MTNDDNAGTDARKPMQPAPELNRDLDPEQDGHGRPFEEGEEAPPPRVRTMAAVRWLLLAAMVIAAGLSSYTYAKPLFGNGPKEIKNRGDYHCPMHPQITSDSPGECPICHMSLEAAATSPSRVLPNAVEPTVQPAGTSPITLSFDRVQAIGVRTVRVQRQATSEALRASATVEPNEKGKTDVHFRGSGFVETIDVNQIGAKVRVGQRLASIYSPEVFQVEQELLLLRGLETRASMDIPSVDAARKKLELLGIDARVIDELLRTGIAKRAISLLSPVSGYVVTKNVVLGSRVTPEMALFEIADLSQVYLVANVYVEQLARIRVGDKAHFTTGAVPARDFIAKVDLIYPEVDAATRTSRVRFQIDNRDLALKPGQFGTAELAGGPVDELVVPMDAVVDTGRATYVFVVEGEGRFSPRLVKVGEQVDAKFVIRDGLRDGETIVSGATFLIDAESRMQASFANLSQPRGGASALPAASECDLQFDREKVPEKWQECKKCEAHRGMGTMEQDCRNAIPKPWR